MDWSWTSECPTHTRVAQPSCANLRRTVVWWKTPRESLRERASSSATTVRAQRDQRVARVANRTSMVNLEFQEVPNTTAFQSICSKNHNAECTFMGFSGFVENPPTITRQTNRVTIPTSKHIETVHDLRKPTVRYKNRLGRQPCKTVSKD